jgi:hypothetical protein
MAGLLFYQAVEKPALFIILSDAQGLNHLKMGDLARRPE